MALIVEFVNDGSGSDDAANYTVRVRVNQRVIARGRICGHNRRDEWTVLVRRLLEMAQAGGAVARTDQASTNGPRAQSLKSSRIPEEPWNIKSEPVRVDVDDIRTLGEQLLPSTKDLSGKYPNITEGMSAEDYIRSIRDD